MCTLLCQVASFPQELVFVGRSTVLIRGIAAALGVEWSLSNEWAPTAAKVLQPRKGVALKATETVVCWDVLFVHDK